MSLDDIFLKKLLIKQDLFNEKILVGEDTEVEFLPARDSKLSKDFVVIMVAFLQAIPPIEILEEGKKFPRGYFSLVSMKRGICILKLHLW